MRNRHITGPYALRYNSASVTARRLGDIQINHKIIDKKLNQFYNDIQ
jgi:hypothetical protein